MGMLLIATFKSKTQRSLTWISWMCISSEEHHKVEYSPRQVSTNNLDSDTQYNQFNSHFSQHPCMHGHLYHIPSCAWHLSTHGAGRLRPGDDSGRKSPEHPTFQELPHFKNSPFNFFTTFCTKVLRPFATNCVFRQHQLKLSIEDRYLVSLLCVPRQTAVHR